MTIRVPLIPWEVVVRRCESPPRRMTLRGAMVWVAVLALLLWAGLLIWRVEDRRWVFRRRVDDHTLGERDASFFYHSLKNTVEYAEAEAADLIAEAKSTEDTALAGQLRALIAGHLKAADNVRAALKGATLREPYHKRLKLKYEHAIRYPYLPVWPDPPPP